MSRRVVILVLCLAVLLAGCGQPFHVVTEPGHAEIYVDGKFAGYGGAMVPTNGIVFNSYDIEARDRDGKVLARDEVTLAFSARSAVFATLGLVGIIFWPLLPFLPLAFFVGDPSPEHVHLRVPDQNPVPPPPEPDALDRPLVQLQAPRQATTIPPGEALVVKGRARHWSGVSQVTVQLDGREVARVSGAADSEEVELPFEARVTADAGHHVVRVTARGLRGSEASEEVRVTFAARPGEPAPPPPEKVPGLEPVGDD